MLKIKNIRRLFALIGTGITLASISGCSGKLEKESDNVSISSLFDNSDTLEDSNSVSINSINESSFLSDSSKKIEDINYYELYWWPIGSEETEIIDGKEFACGIPEKTVIGGKSNYIYGKKGEGVTNIIASKSGIVVYPDKSDKIDYDSFGGTGNSIDSSSGNYVVIKHLDGNYTFYSHLYENSIIVRKGDVVEQGQVLGKMGMSGNIAGTGLGFEIRINENNSSAKANLFDYVSQDAPRPLYNLDEGYNLSLNDDNEWELKYNDELVHVLHSESLINEINAISTVEGIDVFNSEDLIKYKLVDFVLNDKDIIYNDNPRVKVNSR